MLDPHEAAGIWEGKMEPSFIAHIRVKQRDAEYRLAARLGRRHDQDAVLLFHHGRGPDTVQRVRFADEQTAERAVKAMMRHGLQGGS